MRGLALFRRVFPRRVPPLIHYCWVGGRALAEIPRSIDGPAAFNILGLQMATGVFIRAGLRGYSQTPVTIADATILPKDAFYPLLLSGSVRSHSHHAVDLLGASLDQAVVSKRGTAAGGPGFLPESASRWWSRRHSHLLEHMPDFEAAMCRVE